MKATLTYEGKTVEVEIDEKEARKIFDKPKKTGWERVGRREKYRFLSYYIDEGMVEDNLRYQKGFYFSDEQLANDQLRAISLWMRIKRWAAEHCDPAEWDDPMGEQKWHIYYDVDTDCIRCSWTRNMRCLFGVYFDTEEHAEQCIDEFSDDLTWYFAECRYRMDG